MQFHDIEIGNILEQCTPGSIESNLGYFSKIFRVPFQGRELIVKRYHPVKNGASFIMDKHDEYIKRLLEIGIKMPFTQMISNRIKDKTELVILQEPYGKEELFRDIFQHASFEKSSNLCRLIFDDTLKFWKNKPEYEPIGFHPSLRNYAIRNGELFYFDSFPPMNMSQYELNKIIIKMSPFGSLIKPIVPPKAMNRVSDEYYSIVKMITGIAGSCCRLRPEYMIEVLEFSIGFIGRSDLRQEDKESIIRELKTPPKLSGIWKTVRKFSGNVGHPNVVLSGKKQTKLKEANFQKTSTS